MNIIIFIFSATSGKKNAEKDLCILPVGTRLTCHDEKSSLMERALDDWEKALEGRSKKCVLSYSD